MKEIFKHPFVLAAIAFFVVVIGTFSILLWWSSETTTLDTSAWQIIESTISDVDNILDASKNAPDE